MIGAIVFLIIFIFFLLLSLIGISTPPGEIVLTEIIPDILKTDYAQFAEGIINGVLFGLLIYILFIIVKMVSRENPSKKEVMAIVENGSKLESESIVGPVSTSSPIIEIEGIGIEYSEKLKNIEIKTTDELLNAGGTKQGRKEISEKINISETIILEWVNMADLFRIKGIGEEYSDLLKEVRVRTVVQLSRRNPNNLYETILGVNAAKKRVRRPPSLSQIKDWIEQAKSLERKVEY